MWFPGVFRVPFVERRVGTVGWVPPYSFLHMNQHLSGFKKKLVCITVIIFQHLGPDVID